MTKPDTPAPSGAAPADSPNIVQIVEEFVEDYEMRGEDAEGRDCDYSPNENEKCLILDAIWGLLEHDEFKAALASREASSAPKHAFVAIDYATAFYEIASALGIGARTDTPENVFRNEMLPRIVALVSQEADMQEAKDCIERLDLENHHLRLASPQVAPALANELSDQQIDTVTAFFWGDVGPAMRAAYRDYAKLLARPALHAPAAADDARDAAEVWNEAIEAAARRIEGGSFLHDQAPAKLFANEVAPVLRSMKRTPAAKPAEPTQGDAK